MMDPSASHPTCRVAAVVVTYNRAQYLRQCLTSLLNQTRPPDEIIVIDNASTDGTVAMLATEFVGNVTTVRHPKNTGGAGGFHEGIRQAYEAGYDWIWVMDDDVSPDRTALESLIRASHRLPLCGAILPLRLFEDGSLADGTSVDYNLRSLFCLPGAHQRAVQQAFASPSAIPPVLPTANMSFEGPLIRRAAVAAVGLPTSAYFLYGDDTDYAFRLALAGFEIVLVKDALLYRLIRPAGRVSPDRTRYVVRNTLWLNKLYGKTWAVRVMRTAVWAACFLGKHVLCLTWITDRARWRAVLTGAVEGILLRPTDRRV